MRSRKARTGEPKWDGFRGLLFLRDQEQISLRSKSGEDLGRYLLPLQAAQFTSAPRFHLWRPDKAPPMLKQKRADPMKLLA
jgi:ATP-dependent DNA ligase